MAASVVLLSSCASGLPEAEGAFTVRSPDARVKGAETSARRRSREDGRRRLTLCDRWCRGGSAASQFVRRADQGSGATGMPSSSSARASEDRASPMIGRSGARPSWMRRASVAKRRPTSSDCSLDPAAELGQRLLRRGRRGRQGGQGLGSGPVSGRGIAARTRWRRWPGPSDPSRPRCCRRPRRRRGPIRSGGRSPRPTRTRSRTGARGHSAARSGSFVRSRHHGVTGQI